MKAVDTIQGVLNFENCTNKHFRGNGMGKIGTTGFVLGTIGGIHFGVFCAIAALYWGGIDLPTSPRINALQTWSMYMSLLCFFHFMEFFTTAINQPASLSYDSYIVNHSKAYTIAAAASWVEFWIEYAIFGQRKLWWSVSALGLLLVLLGQGVRTVGMWHCGRHFSHIIMHDKRDEHQLVTTGIYSYLRHPSYFGWFYWSVGTQLLLCNPLCTAAYAYAAWTFFAGRIPYEEGLLVDFYGAEYVQYAQGTVIGIPGIAGHVRSAVTAKDVVGWFRGSRADSRVPTAGKESRGISGGGADVNGTGSAQGETNSSTVDSKDE